MEKSIGRDSTLASPLAPSSIITDTLLGLLKATYFKFNTGLHNELMREKNKISLKKGA